MITISGKVGHMEKLFEGSEEVMFNIEDMIVWSRDKKYKLVEVTKKGSGTCLGFNRVFAIKVDKTK